MKVALPGSRRLSKLLLMASPWDLAIPLAA
jgi:hypothetical protein